LGEKTNGSRYDIYGDALPRGFQPPKLVRPTSHSKPR